MAELTPEHIKMITDTSNDVREIKIVLKGYDGQNGLVRRVENNRRQLVKIWVVVSVLAASTGGGVLAIFQAILH